MGDFDLSRVFVNTGGYGLQLAPPETSQTPDAQPHAPANDQPQIPYTPAISPPSTELNIREAYSIVSDYAAAETELLANIPSESIDAYYADEEVSADQRGTLESYDQKRIALVEYEQTLFRQAFLSDPDPAAQDKWRQFEELLTEAKIGEGIAQVLISLADPHMDPVDRILLYDLAFSEEVSDDLALQIEDRFIYSWREDKLAYNGFGSPLSPEQAFLNGLYIVYGEGLNSMVQAVFTDRLSETLALFSGEAAQRYLQMSGEDFDKEIFASQREYERAPLGSNLRIIAYQRLADLNTIAYVRGVDYEGSSEEIMDINFPGISSNDLDRLETATQNQQQFISSIEYFAEEFYKSDLNDERRFLLIRILCYLDSMASAYGIDRQQMDEYLTQAKQKVDNVPTLDAVASMNDLDPDHDVSVSPEGLPIEVKEILMQTGYWEQVSQLREIRLLSGEVDLPDSRIFNDTSFDGLAYAYLGAVEIEWNGMPAWMIADALVHEAAHVAWRNEAQNEYERESLPNERHSCLMEAGFLHSYLNDMNIGEEERRNVELLYVDRVASVTSTNLAMGVAPDNYDSHLLPSPEYLATLGLEDISQFDLNIAAYFQVHAYADDEISLHNFIWEGVDRPEAELNIVQDILGKVMRDSFLGLNYAYDQGVITDIEISLVSDSGPNRNLNDDEAQALLHFFPSMQALASLASRSQYSDETGFSYLISGSDLLPEIYSYNLRYHPNSLLNR